MLLFFGITLWTMSQQADNIARESDKFSTYVSQREAIQKRVKDAGSKLTSANGEFEEAVELLKKRNNLIAFYSLIRSCICRTTSGLPISRSRPPPAPRSKAPQPSRMRPTTIRKELRTTADCR